MYDERARAATRTTRASRKSPPDHNPGQEKCGAKKTDGSGERCGNDAGYGTEHLGVGACKHHGGCTESGMKKAAAILAARTMGAYGAGEVDIEPHEAILWCVRMAAHEVQYIARHMADLAEEVVDAEEQEDPNHFASRKLQALMAEKAKSMDRLAKYGKMAVDAGVAQHQIRIAEGYGAMLAQLLGAVFEDLQLSPAQRRMAPLIAERRLFELETQTVVEGTAKELTP